LSADWVANASGALAVYLVAYALVYASMLSAWMPLEEDLSEIADLPAEPVDI
jgi:hypothetical protein